MQIRGTFEVYDDPEAKLSSLSRAIRSRILRKAMRAGAKIVHAQLKRNAPRRLGALRASIAIRIKTKRRGGVTYAVIGPKRRFKGRKGSKIAGKNVLPTKYAHLVEKGTKPHSLRKRGSADGAVGKMHPGARPKPFISPAWESTRDAAVAAIRSAIEDGIAKVLAKRAAKAAAAASSLDGNEGGGDGSDGSG